LTDGRDGLQERSGDWQRIGAAGCGELGVDVSTWVRNLGLSVGKTGGSVGGVGGDWFVGDVTGCEGDSTRTVSCC
jgi:hypothetical protein